MPADEFFWHWKESHAFGHFSLWIRHSGHTWIIWKRVYIAGSLLPDLAKKVARQVQGTIRVTDQNGQIVWVAKP
jgi:hypothetical protein